MIVILLASGIFGLFIGSFLNVVIYRYNTGLSFVSGRSQCFVCGHKLSWYELIPLMSFIIQRGRCRACGSRISIQYPIVELVTGILFMLVAWRQYNLYPLYASLSHGDLISGILFVFYLVVMCLFVVMGVYDIKHKIIPDGMVYTFAGLAASKLALFVYLFGVPMTRITTLNMFTPLILFTPFALLWLVSRGMWIGFGDAKLVFGIGALLGFIGGINAVVIAFWIGALWGVGHMILSRIKQDQSIVTLSSEVPFAPFLIIGTCIALFTQLDILSLSNFFHV